jgi:glycosyltransferase involved in cell wall biosynthesis
LFEKILFVGHDANRAGAQYLLLHLLTYLKKSGVQTGLLLVDDGYLVEDFKRVTTVYLANPAQPTSDRPHLLQGVIRRMGISGWSSNSGDNGYWTNLLAELKSQNYDLIFSNTIVNGAILKELAPLDIPFVCYVHELETSIRIYTCPKDLEYQIQNAAHIICGSDAVRKNLVNTHGLPADRASVINSLIDVQALVGSLQKVDRIAVRSRLGIPQDALVVGGCGNAEWRKGVDIFILVAQQILKSHPGMHFIWVGVQNDGEDFKHLTHDLAKMGIDKNVHLIGPCAEYLDYVACYDIFTLTSREDPYPLVILEAGLNQVPVLCFADSGGSPDFVGNDTGCVIAYSDVAEMASVIGQLAVNEDHRKHLGEVFKTRAEAHDVAVLVPKIFSLLSGKLILT